MQQGGQKASFVMAETSADGMLLCFNNHCFDFDTDRQSSLSVYQSGTSFCRTHAFSSGEFSQKLLAYQSRQEENTLATDRLHL